MNQIAPYIYPILLILLVFVFTESTRNVRRTHEGKYKSNKFLMTNAERDFYNYLTSITPSSKVRLEDIV